MICNMSFGAYIILYATLTIGEDLIKRLCLGTTCIKYRPLTDISERLSHFRFTSSSPVFWKDIQCKQVQEMITVMMSGHAHGFHSKTNISQTCYSQTIV